MKLKDFLYIGIIALLVIKILITAKPPEQLPKNDLQDSLKSYRIKIENLETLLKVNQNERDSLSKERNKITTKYIKEYEQYRIKDSFANSLSVDSIQKFWTKRYDHN